MSKEDIGLVGISDDSMVKELALPQLPDFNSFANPPELPKIILSISLIPIAILIEICFGFIYNLIPDFEKPESWNSWTNKEKMQWLVLQIKNYLPSIKVPDLTFNDNTIKDDCLEVIKSLVPKIPQPSANKDDLLKILKLAVPNIIVPFDMETIEPLYSNLQIRYKSQMESIKNKLSFDKEHIANDVELTIKALVPSIDINLMLQKVLFPIATTLTNLWKTGDKLVTKFATTYPDIKILTTETLKKKLLYRIKLGEELRLYDPKAKIHWEYYLRMKNCILQNYLKNSILITFAYSGIIQSTPPLPDPLTVWTAKIKGFKKDLKSKYDSWDDYLDGIADVIKSAQIEPVINTCQFNMEATFNSNLKLSAHQIKDSSDLYTDNLSAIASSVVLDTMTKGINLNPIPAQNLAANSSGIAQMISITFLA